MRGDHRLSQAEAAIAGRDFGMREYTKSAVLESALQVGKQVHVVERSAAQADAIQSSAFADHLRQLHKNLNQAIVKTLADARNREMVLQVCDEGLESRFRVHHPGFLPANEIDRISMGHVHIPDLHFKLNGRLRFVVHLAANSCQCGYRVE